MEQEDVLKKYEELYPLYEQFAKSIADDITKHLDGIQLGVHMVTYRTKDLKSFAAKSERYFDPLSEIKDIAGIRVVTYITSDIPAITDYIENKYEIDPEHSANKSHSLGENIVGYKSHHFVGKYKDSDLDDDNFAIFKGLTFEIQVRTLQQHAWAEIEHDNKYKFKGKLPFDIRRRFNVLAGALEIVDAEFDNLSKEVRNIVRETEESIGKDDYNIEIDMVSLIEFINKEFSTLIQHKKLINNLNSNDYILDELKIHQVHKVSDLKQIIPSKLETTILNTPSNFIISAVDLLRVVMIVSNEWLYNRRAYKKDWDVTGRKSMLFLFGLLDVDTSTILNHYTALRPPSRDDQLRKFWSETDTAISLQQGIVYHLKEFAKRKGISFQDIVNKGYYDEAIWHMFNWNEILKETGSQIVYRSMVAYVLNNSAEFL